MTQTCERAGSLRCSCQAPEAIDASRAPSTDRLLFATAVSHTVGSLRSSLAEIGLTVTQRAPGLLEVLRTSSQPDLATLLAAVSTRMTTVEADEIRVLCVGDEGGDDLLSAALHAPTLRQLDARAEHAGLVPLLEDELNAFHSVYQPIVSLTTPQNPTIGYEALLRATGPHGPVLPDTLFSWATAAGWLHALDRIGRTTALRGAAGWLGDAALFVNFIPTTIYRPEVCLRTTEEAVEKSGLRLDQLVFEVTESEQITDVTHLARVFDYYRARGCRVALDDLGSGFSSLNKLVELQPDVVKLDKELVQRLPDPVSCAVITAVVQMTHSYGGVVLAECVETQVQAAAAVDLGVDLAQGWYFGRPEPREVITAPGRPRGRAAGSATS